MTFVLKYPENNGRTDGADPWSIRQTGVYQSYDSGTKASLWILLNPRQSTALDTRVRALLNSSQDALDEPSLLGLIALSTYFVNWRAYMAYWEKEELRLVGQAFQSSVIVAKFCQSGVVISAIINEELQFSHSTLSELRRLEARLLLLPPIFHSIMESIKILEAFNDALHTDSSISDETHNTTQEILQNYSNTAAAYSHNATFIRDKIRGTAQLLSDTLNLKHQQIAQRISENTLALNDAAVRESATIRVITVVTLLFLPSSFVAVSAPQ